MLTDVITMLDWAMVNDAELADRVLSSSAAMIYGLGRWPELNRACDWMLVDRPRGPDWPGAVASVSMLASFIGRSDVFALTEQAMKLATRLGDTTTVRVLSVGPAIAAFARGDLAPLRALIAGANTIDADYAAYLATTCLGFPLAEFGQLEELKNTCRIGSDFVAGTFDIMNSGVGPALVMADYLAGDPNVAVEHLPRRGASWEMIARQYAAVAGRIAVDRDDPAVAELAATWIGPHDTPDTAVYPLLLAWARAVLGGDLVAAAAHAATAVEATRYVPVQGRALTDLAATLAHLERWGEVGGALQRLGGLLDAIDEPAPALRARGAVVEARLALARDRIPDALDAAHRALRTATDAGLILIQIDALETLAMAAAATGDHATAATLLGATTADRRRRGYGGRFTTPAPASLLDELASTHAHPGTPEPRSHSKPSRRGGSDRAPTPRSTTAVHRR
jgi:hypothetical protein